MLDRIGQVKYNKSTAEGSDVLPNILTIFWLIKGAEGVKYLIIVTQYAEHAGGELLEGKKKVWRETLDI